MQTPFFSIIIPIYNREKQLLKTLDSVKNQTFTDYEVILIDDASTDNSYQICMNYEIQNKIVIRNEQNSERCVSRNKGIEKANGKYICFLDSDDTFLPNHLQTFYDAIIAHKYPKAMFFTNSYIEDEYGNKRNKEVPDFQVQNVFAYLLKYTPNPARVCVERSIFETIKFDPAIPGIEDLDAWLHIAKSHQIIHIPKYTNVYFVHSESYTKGDTKRHEKELQFFTYMFQKEAIKNSLPSLSKRRLLSNSHYHLAVKADELRQRKIFYKHAYKSFFLYPKGYNNQIPKSLFVMSLYNLPLLGRLGQFVYRKAIKRQSL